MQKDMDGKFTYSPVVTLLNKKGLKQSILAPNPASGYTLLVLDQAAHNASLSIFNTGGQWVKSMAISERQTQQLVNLSGIKTGHYSIRLQNNGNLETLKLIKE
jgi:hypothetical protein